MAKAPSTPVAPSHAFAYETLVLPDVPALARGGFAKAGETNKLQQDMENLPTPQPGKLAALFLPAEIDPNITDEAEKAKAFKEATRKLANNASSRGRKITKADPSKAYAVRTQTYKGRLGVVVIRVVTEAAVPAAAAAAPPAPPSSPTPPAPPSA